MSDTPTHSNTAHTADTAAVSHSQRAAPTVPKPTTWAVRAAITTSPETRIIRGSSSTP